MPMEFDNVDIKEINFDGVDVLYAEYDGVLVWSKERNISVNFDDNFTSVEGVGAYIQGTTCTLTANPKPKDDTGVWANDYMYLVEGWYVDGVKVSSENKYTFVVERDVTIELKGRKEPRMTTIVLNGSRTSQTKYNVASFRYGDRTDRESFDGYNSCSDDAHITLDVTKATKFKARFAVNAYGTTAGDPPVGPYTTRTFNGVTIASNEVRDVSALTGNKQLSLFAYGIGHGGGQNYGSLAYIYDVYLYE